MAQLPTEIITHSRRVCSLYKRALLCIREVNVDRLSFRYDAVKLRKRFDDNARILDLRLAKHLLLQGEKELFIKDYNERITHPDSVGGVAYEREVVIPDCVLDQWHPKEKAMYPKYFARREQRKKEYLEWYYKEYPDKKSIDGGSH